LISSSKNGVNGKAIAPLPSSSTSRFKLNKTA
jgi:hypothetical protein